VVGWECGSEGAGVRSGRVEEGANLPSSSPGPGTQPSALWGATPAPAPKPSPDPSPKPIPPADADDCQRENVRRRTADPRLATPDPRLMDTSAVNRLPGQKSPRRLGASHSQRPACAGHPRRALRSRPVHLQPPLRPSRDPRPAATRAIPGSKPGHPHSCLLRCTFVHEQAVELDEGVSMPKHSGGATGISLTTEIAPLLTEPPDPRFRAFLGRPRWLARERLLWPSARPRSRRDRMRRMVANGCLTGPACAPPRRSSTTRRRWRAPRRQVPAATAAARSGRARPRPGR
jgi:hypothetical protein